MNDTQKRFLTNAAIGAVSSLIVSSVFGTRKISLSRAMASGFFSAAIAEVYVKPVVGKLTFDEQVAENRNRIERDLVDLMQPFSA